VRDVGTKLGTSFGWPMKRTFVEKVHATAILSARSARWNEIPLALFSNS
jgi:hypothetical protein